MIMKFRPSLATFSLGAILMTQIAHAAPDAATDPRIVGDLAGWTALDVHPIGG